MKWHICNNKFPSQILTWNGMALEFDTKEDAQRFIDSFPDTKDDSNIYPEEGILFYDNGYLNATGKIVEYSNDEKGIFMEVT